MKTGHAKAKRVRVDVYGLACTYQYMYSKKKQLSILLLNYGFIYTYKKFEVYISEAYLIWFPNYNLFVRIAASSFIQLQ